MIKVEILLNTDIYNEKLNCFQVILENNFSMRVKFMCNKYN